MAAAKQSQYSGILVNNSDVKAEVLTTVVGEHNTINVHPPPPQTKQYSGIIFNVQKSVHSFTGREDIISQLHKKIDENKQSSTPTVVTQSATICGTGGVGKTETVRKYIQTYGNSYKNVIWVNAESYSEAKSCFIHLADRLSVQTALTNGIAKEDKLLAEEIYSTLTDPTLVVFDNVQREEEDGNKGNVGLFFPKTILGKKMHWAIILTTRERNYNDQPKIDLDGLSQEECYELLISSLKITKSEENHHAALKIQELCEGLPIVVQQVIAIVKKENNSQQVMSQKDYSLSDYVTSVHANLYELTKAMPADSPVGKSVYTIFQLTFKKLQNSESGRTALYCLDVMSLLNPENIPVLLLKHLVTDTSDGEFSTSILLLIQHNLITERNQLLKIHRMIQAIRRQDVHFLNKTYLKQSNFSSFISKLFGTGKKSPKIILRSFSQFLDKIALNDDHIHQILDNGIRLQMTCKGLVDVNTNEQFTFTDQLRKKLTKIGRYNDAEELCQLIVKQREKLLGKSHLDTLNSKYYLAIVYQYQGKYDQAEELYKVVLQEREKLLRKNHHDTLKSKQGLAIVYQYQGKYDQAEEIHQGALQEQEGRLGKSHPSTLYCKHNLATVYENQGKYRQAEELYNVVVQASPLWGPRSTSRPRLPFKWTASQYIQNNLHWI